MYTNATDNTGVAEHSGTGFTTASLNLKSSVYSANGKMYFEFKTDAVVSKKGFYGVYSVGMLAVHKFFIHCIKEF